MICEAEKPKFYSASKKFGFVIDLASGQEFFLHESKIPSGITLQAGDEVTFESIIQRNGNGNNARPSAVILSSRGTTTTAADVASIGRNGAPKEVPIRTNGTVAYASMSTTSTAASKGTRTGGASGVYASASTTTVTTSTASSSLSLDKVTMPCFTMSQPFATLLLNGVKSVESRNNPMFQNIKPGTQLLLHIGKRDWHDVESFRTILAKDDDNQYNTAAKVDHVSRLPRGFHKGSIAGIITVGKTWKATNVERQHATLQRQVLASFEGIGKFCTEITAAQWLNRSIPMSGNAGVYNVEIPKDCLPDQ